MNQAEFKNWLNLPKGWRVAIVETKSKDQDGATKQTTATLTSSDATTYTYRVVKRDGKYVLEDPRNLHGVSDNNAGRDAAEYSESVTTAEASIPADSVQAVLQDRFHLSAEQAASVAAWHKSDKSDRADDIARVFGLLLARRSVAASLWGMAFAAGLDAVAGRSMTAVARTLGCTRALISKESCYWTDALKLPRSRYQKSEHARQSYSRAQRRRTR